MMRILSPRSVETTTRSRRRWDSPKVIKRSSSCECSGSGIVRASGSPKTEAPRARTELQLKLERLPPPVLAVIHARHAHEPCADPQLRRQFRVNLRRIETVEPESFDVPPGKPPQMPAECLHQEVAEVEQPD